MHYKAGLRQHLTWRMCWNCPLFQVLVSRHGKLPGILKNVVQHCSMRVFRVSEIQSFYGANLDAFDLSVAHNFEDPQLQFSPTIKQSVPWFWHNLTYGNIIILIFTNHLPIFTPILPIHQWFANMFTKKENCLFPNDLQICSPKKTTYGEFLMLTSSFASSKLRVGRFFSRSFWSSWTCRSFGRRWSGGVSWLQKGELTMEKVVKSHSSWVIPPL